MSNQSANIKKLSILVVLAVALTLALAVPAFASVTAITVDGPDGVLPVGSNATFTATATNPGGTTLYQFWVHDQNGWRTVQNYSTTNTYTMSSLPVGSYVFAVYALDQADLEAGNWAAAKYQSFVINVGSSVSLSGAFANGQITLTATAANLNNTVYQFWYQKPDGTWVGTDYSSSSTYSFTPATEGDYKAIVYAKDPYAPNDATHSVWSTVQTINVAFPLSVQSVSAINGTALDGSTGVSLTPTISVVFSKDAGTANVNSTNITLASASGTAVSTNVAYNATTHTATVTLPSGIALNPNTQYVLTIGTGTGIASAVKATFTTGNNPVVVSTTPLPGKNITAGTNPSITFNTSMDPATITTTTVKLYDATNSQYIPINIVGVNNNKTFNITRVDGAAVGAGLNVSYQLIVTTGAKALDGTPLASQYTLNFVDAAALGLGANAMDNTVGVYGRTVSSLLGTAFRYTAAFTQDMDATTINTTNIQLVKASDNSQAPIAVSYDSGARTVTVTLQQDLAEGTAYQLIFGTGIKSALGVPLANPIVRNFSTGYWNTPSIVSTTPANGTSGFDVTGTSQRLSITFDRAVANVAGAAGANFQNAGGVNNQATVMLTNNATGAVINLSGAGVVLADPSSNNKTWNITLPAGTMSTNASYTLSIKGQTAAGDLNIVDANNAANFFKTRVDVVFTTAADTTALAIVGVYKDSLAGTQYTTQPVTNVPNNRVFVFKTNRPLAVTFAADGVATNIPAANATLRNLTTNALVPLNTVGTTLQGITTAGLNYSTITLTLNAADFAADGKYRLTLTGLTDRAVPANTMAGNYTFDFVVDVTNTALDATSPVVADGNSYVFNNDANSDGVYSRAVDGVVTPNGAVGVKVNAPIHIGFNEVVTNLNSTNITLTTGGTAVTGTVTVDSNNMGFKFTPSANLAYSSLYTLTVGTGVTDLVGNPLAAPLSVQFTTEAAALPKLSVVSTSPANGATGVAVNAPITVTFNAPVTGAGVTGVLTTGSAALAAATPNAVATTIALHNVTDDTFITGGVSLDSSGKVATITPKGILQAGKNYRIELGGGLTTNDNLSAGGTDTTLTASGATTQFTFQTEATPSVTPQIVSATYVDANGSNTVNAGDVIIVKLNAAVTSAAATVNDANVVGADLTKYALSDGGRFTDGIAADATATLSADGKSIIITLGANPILIPNVTQINLTAAFTGTSNGTAYSTEPITITK